MAGSWKKDKINGCRIGIFYDSIEMNPAGTQARIKGGKVRFSSDVNVVDQTNHLSWSGGAVTDGSSNNKKLRGSGARTIQSVTGTWITLSTTTTTKVTASASFSGVNYAGSTLTHSITVTLPIAGDGGTVSPDPGVGGDAYPNPWEDDNGPDWATEPYVEHVYAVRLPGAPAPLQSVPAWDVSVDLDGGRAPYGVCRFKAPVSYLSEANYAHTNPRAQPVVQVDAGWRYPGAENLHTLFSGVITERVLQVDPSGAYVQVTAESYETILEYPSHIGPVGVSNAYTTVKQVYDANAFYRRPAWVEHPANIAPTAPQLAEYRAMGIEKDDTVGDWLRACSSTMGQWMRGDLTSTTPKIENLTDPYPYQRLVEMDVNAFAELDRVENLDQWANILRLTTQWTNGSGDQVSKRRTYAASGVSGGSGAVRSRDVTLNLKPPSGATPPANWAPALRWLRRVNEASRGSRRSRG